MKVIHFLARNYFLTIVTIAFIVTSILDLAFGIDNFWMRILIALPIIILLSPKKKKIETSSGQKTQITWFLLKEAIILDK